MKKEQEKQTIIEDTKELTEKKTKISQEMEKMTQELQSVQTVSFEGVSDPL